jgi:hypothetical protein
MNTSILLKEAIQAPVAPRQGRIGPAGYAALDIALRTTASIHVWTRLRLAPNETAADRLRALLVGITDENKDGEITDDEQGVLTIARGVVWRYLEAKAIFPDDLDDILNHWEPSPTWDSVLNAWMPSTADRVRDYLVQALPAGKLAVADIDRFVFNTDPETLLDTRMVTGTVPPTKITDGQRAAILEARRLAAAVTARRAVEFVAWRERRRARVSR